MSPNPAILTWPRAVVAGGGFLPTDISGLMAWYKADAITGVADGANTSTWPDSSGNGYNANMARTYRATGANGKPAVEWNANGGVSLPTFTISQPNVSVVALVYLSGGALGQSISSPMGTGAHDLGFASDGTPYFGFYSGTAPAGGAAVGATALAQSTWGIIGGSYSDSGNTLAVRLNGSQATATTATSATNGRAARLGGWPNNGAKLVGRIAEVIYYSATLTAQQFVDIEGYLATKYGL